MVHAAAPCPVDVKRRMLEWWGPVIYEYYAASEGGGTLVTPEEWLRYPGTVGRAWPTAEVRILDDGGNPVPIEHAGDGVHGARRGRVQVPQGRREDGRRTGATDSSPSATSAT